jgi:hypothetical protein
MKGIETEAAGNAATVATANTKQHITSAPLAIFFEAMILESRD